MQNLPVQKMDSKNVTKIVILTKALKAIDKLKKEEKRLTEEKTERQELNTKLSEEHDRLKKVVGLFSGESSEVSKADMCSPDIYSEDVDDSLQDMEEGSSYQMHVSTPENKTKTVKAKTVFPPVRIVKKQDPAECKGSSSAQSGQRISGKKRPVPGAKETETKVEFPSQIDSPPNETT